jgi:hypothetical protein
MMPLAILSPGLPKSRAFASTSTISFRKFRPETWWVKMRLADSMAIMKDTAETIMSGHQTIIK